MNIRLLLAKDFFIILKHAISFKEINVLIMQAKSLPPSRQSEQASQGRMYTHRVSACKFNTLFKSLTLYLIR